MNNNNPYSGTILENTYTPVVFSSATDNPAAQIEAGSKKAATSAAITAAVTAAAAVTLPLSLPAVLVSSIVTGTALYFKPQKSNDIVRSLQAADILVETAALTTFDLW